MRSSSIEKFAFDFLEKSEITKNIPTLMKSKEYELGTIWGFDDDGDFTSGSIYSSESIMENKSIKKQYKKLFSKFAEDTLKQFSDSNGCVEFSIDRDYRGAHTWTLSLFIEDYEIDIEISADHLPIYDDALEIKISSYDQPSESVLTKLFMFELSGSVNL